MMELGFVDELAEITDARWAAAGHSEEAFAEIAAEALEEVGAHRRTTTAEVLRAVLKPWKIPRYQVRHTSPTVVTLYSAGQFQIFAHLWVDAVGSPHQHGWAGAYQVVEGSSLQALFDFEEHQRVRSSFHLGETRVRELRYLRSGEVVAVPAGEQLIHGLAHIERPTLSISLRATHPAALTLDYARPGVAYRSYPLEPHLENRLRCLDVLQKTNEADWNQALCNLVRDHDLMTSFFALRQASLQRQPISEEVLAAARKRHGELFGFVERSLESFHLTAKLESLRQLILDEDLRFFLGCLYLAESRAQVLELVASRFKDRDPGALIGGWLGRLLVEVDDSEDSIPEVVSTALGELALGADLETMLAKAGRELAGMADFLRQAGNALRQALIYRPLFVSK